ncbi:MAG: HEAT repeat domain-containing protein [Candidatus Hydrogenedentes bacterium]|nr:HEAT repeat domain-containing protein [Candidatus Hydrogenedentota bacterium]
MCALRFAGPIGLGLLVLLIASCATDQDRPLPPMPSTYSPELLAEVLGRKHLDFESYPYGVYAKRSAIELGEKAVPSIAEVLHNASNDEIRRNACTALAYVGGPKSVEILKDCYSRTGDSIIMMGLCLALSSVGSPTDRQYLLETVEQYLGNGDSAESGPRYFDRSTLYALGVVREQQAIPVLEELVRRQDILSFEASQVLRWIKRGFFAVPVLENPTERDKVILAVLRNGLENTLDAQTAHLHEVDSNRSWLRSPDGWEVAYTDDNPDRMPRVRFEVFISSDGQRALCETGQTFGFLAGVGYDYVLRRDASEWKVVGMNMTWIS